MSFNLGNWSKQLSCDMCSPSTGSGSGSGPSPGEAPDFMPGWGDVEFDDPDDGFFRDLPEPYEPDDFDIPGSPWLERGSPGYILNWEIFTW